MEAPFQRIGPCALTLAVLALAPSSARAQCWLERLVAPDGTTGAQFGRCVALDGTDTLVGESGAPGGGAVHVYANGSPTWSHTQTITPPDVAEGSRFGHSLALDGPRLLVGAPGDFFGSAGAGRAYLFERSTLRWTEQPFPAPMGGTPGDGAGWAVALDEDRALVGALWDDTAGNNAGAVHVYERTVSGWSQVTTLLAPDAESFERFGDAVAIGGDLAFVHAESGGAPMPYAGSVYVYERVAGTWTYQTRIESPDGFPGDQFGAALELDGGRAFIGAPGNSPFFFEQGAVYVFEQGQADWTNVAKLSAAGWAQPYGHFGTSLDHEGGRVLVGAPDHFPAGEAFLLRETPPFWNLEPTLRPYDGGADAEFGASVALADELGAVGAPAADGTEPQAGALYPHDVPAAGCRPLVAVPATLSVTSGGTQYYDVRAGWEHAIEQVLVLGSATGTSPGIPLPGGSLLPLAVDDYFVFGLSHPSAPPIADALQWTDFWGSAIAHFVLAPGGPPGLVGLTLHHAYVTLPDLGFASNAVSLQLGP